MALSPTSSRPSAGASSPFVSKGPFTVTFADSPGIVLWTPAVGEIIMDLVVIPTVTWSDGSSLEIYCDALDFVHPLKGASGLTVAGDSTRFVVPVGTNHSYQGIAGAGSNSTPCVMRTATPVQCDVNGAPAVGTAVIVAWVIPA